MKISIIVAMANQHVIGKDNKMPWHMPADLKHFKSLTLNKPVIMGRKTFESIGKALPNRRNIILTRQSDFSAQNGEIFSSLEKALNACVDHEEVMIIGGSTIYERTLPLADLLYLTIIDAAIDGDSYFPAYSHDEWKLIDCKKHSADKDNPYPYRFLMLERV